MRHSLPVLLIACVSSHAQELPSFDTGLDNHAGLVFSPDGMTAYWAAWNGTWGSEPTSPRTIYQSSLENGAWSRPAVATFSGTHNDDDPFVSPDGRWLYFVSERPAFAGDDSGDGDIWRYSLAGDGVLERLDINSDAAEYSPVVTGAGSLYFASVRDGGMGQGDIYRSTPMNSGFEAPELLGPAVNSPTGEWNVWVSPEETELLFEASSRSTNVSVPGDLYFSRNTTTGWSQAVPVASINSADSDLLARVHDDTLYYTTAPIGAHARLVSTGWPDIVADLEEKPPTLLVVNRSSHTVAFVDLDNGEVLRTTATGRGPHLLSNVDAGRVIATGFGEYPRPHPEPVSKRPPFVEELNSTLTLIDVETGEVLLETRLDRCDRPHASWIVGNRGFVTCQDEQVVLEVDLQSGEPVMRFDSMQQGTHVLSFDPETGVLAATNTGSGSVTLISIDSGETRVVELAGGSEGMTRIDGLFWIANGFEGSVSVVDPGTGAVVAHTASLCSFPIAISGDARGRAWVACFGSGELLAIDRSSFELVERHELDAQPLHVLVHAERNRAYVALPRENAVAEIDLDGGTILRRIRTGMEPDGLRFGH